MQQLRLVVTVADVSDFIQFEIWDIPGQFKLGDIDAVATFSCTGTLIFIIDSQVVSLFNYILTHLMHICVLFKACCLMMSYIYTYIDRH